MLTNVTNNNGDVVIDIPITTIISLFSVTDGVNIVARQASDNTKTVVHCTYTATNANYTNANVNIRVNYLVQE